LLLVIADLGPTTFRHPFHPVGTDFPNRASGGYEALRERYADGDPDLLPTARTLHLSAGGHSLLLNSWMVFRTGLASALGVYDESPVAVDLLSKPLDRRMGREVLDSPSPDSLRLSATVAGALRLLNVGSAVAQLPRPGSLTRYQGWTFEASRPVIASARLEAWPLFESEADPDGRLDRLVADMGLNWRRGTSDLIPVAEGPTRRLETTPDIEVLEHVVRNQHAALLIRSSTTCFVRLPYAYFPSLDVRVDDRPVTPIRTADSFIALEMPEGEHRVTLTGRLSALRKGLLATDALLLGGVCLAGAIRHRRQQMQIPYNRGEDNA
jgi:hypothetical protein